jgi:hypothetical protein
MRPGAARVVTRSPFSTSLFFRSRLVYVSSHEGWLCQTDNINAVSLAPGGGREGGLPPSR